MAESHCAYDHIVIDQDVREHHVGDSAVERALIDRPKSDHCSVRAELHVDRASGQWNGASHRAACALRLATNVQNEANGQAIACLDCLDRPSAEGTSTCGCHPGHPGVAWFA